MFVGSKIVVQAGVVPRKNWLIQRLVKTELFPEESVTLQDANDNRIDGQLSQPGLEYDQVSDQRLLTFIVPAIDAHQSIEYTVAASVSKPPVPFVWHDDRSTQAQLMHCNVPVLQYMYEALDDSSQQRRQETYKVFHHACSPDGKHRLTKGAGGLFPHHRGIFFGFNRIRYDGQSADVWHCHQGESQSHEASIQQIGGPVFGRDQNLIFWNGRDGKPFAEEYRQLSAYRFDGNILLEFVSILKSKGSRIQLDGDPQHAGVQFRAAQSVADETKAKTFYIRPDGIDAPGSFRNWSDAADESAIHRAHVDLPWLTMCFYLRDRQYSCCYLNHNDNPRPTMFSERDYGRFGGFFRYELTPEKPLRVQYRFWIQPGVLTVESANALAANLTKLHG